jgi:hypothetical protein
MRNNRGDALLEKCSKQATLDAFWSRENSTVQGARSNLGSAMQKVEMVHGDSIFPALGALPLKDVDGMGAAALQLLKTLDPGVNEPLVQCSTAKGLTAAMGAMWEAWCKAKKKR